MKAIQTYIILILALLFTLPEAAISQYVVKGVVKEGALGIPLENVVVIIDETGANTLTNSAGEYSVSVDTGEYRTVIVGPEQRYILTVPGTNWVNFWFDPPNLPSDFDRNYYQTVVIGDQTWMQENLKTSRYLNGDAITYMPYIGQWGPPLEGAYYNYNNDENNGEIYGRLYNWYAIEDSRNICPSGWHVPSYNDFGELVILNGGTAGLGGFLKQASEVYWTPPNIGATNASGFTALPGGEAILAGEWPSPYSISFDLLGIKASFWSSSEYIDIFDTNEAHYLTMANNTPDGGIGRMSERNSLSVRCLMDPTLPEISIADFENVSQNSATVNGLISSQGSAPISAAGVCWNTSGNPTTGDSFSNDVNDLGDFTSAIEGLLAETTYYVRPYATNAVGTAYGNELSFTSCQPYGVMINTTGVSCFGEADATIEVIITGWSLPILFEWSGPNEFTSESNYITSLEPGDYHVTFTDQNGCMDRLDISVSEPDLLEILNITTTDETCLGCQDGSINIDISGGYSGYTYNWTGPDGFTSTSQDISNLTTGDYTVTVTDMAECTVSASVFINNPLIVTNTDNSGFGSLRYAIEYANTGHAGPDEIQFNIPGPGPHFIQPQSMLPTITETLNINGLSQPGAQENTSPPGQAFNSVLMIEIDGSFAGEPASCFIITANSCVIKGLAITRFSNRGIALWENEDCWILENNIGADVEGTGTPGNGNGVFGIELWRSNNNTIRGNIISDNGGTEPNPGISVHENCSGNLIAGNLIGCDKAGTTALHNSGAGIEINNSPDNMIGGYILDDRNLVADGVNINGPLSTGNKIIGNFIGPEITGQTALGMAGGVSLYEQASGNEIGPRNVISGNQTNGIVISGSGTSENKVFGNYIGLNSSGDAINRNMSTNVVIENATNNRIGGLTPDSANVISGSESDHGIHIMGASSTRNNIVGNHIGTNAAGDEALGNMREGIVINNDASNNVIGPANLIAGNNGFGIHIGGELSGNNKILLNRIGTNASGEALLSNGDDGINIYNSPDNLIDGNVICGAGVGSVGNNGIEMYGLTSQGNTISNNYIGTSRTSGINLGNGYNGIHIAREAHHNTVGPNNYICSNYGSGILIDSEETVSADNNLILENHIGTDVNGNPNLGNGVHGIDIRGSSKSTSVGPDNIIAGNTYDGIHIENIGSTGTRIFDNIIGTNTSNSIEIGNGSMGIVLNDNVSNTTIGPGNIVSGNGIAGIQIHEGSSDNVIIGNYVGTTTNAMGPLGNAEHGIHINSPNNTIGGNNPEDRNIVSANGYFGIELGSELISGCEVYGNYLGTDVTGNGSLPNSAADLAINNSSFNIIGGLEPENKNVIGAMSIVNQGAHDNQIVGNYIGIKADGTGALDFEIDRAGILISDASENTIGPKNIISGTSIGIYITENFGVPTVTTQKNRLIGNLIGTNADGNLEVPNRIGVLIEDAIETGIGGTAESDRNIISGNEQFGIQINGSATGTLVQNNFIGTSKDGVSAIPNEEGVTLGPETRGNYIGTGVNGIGNLIANNNGAGVGLAGEQNYVLGNVIRGHSTDGIYNTGNYNTIGGPFEADRNYLYGNNNGISIFPGRHHNLIEGNVLGTDPEGREDKTDGYDGISIGGSDNVVKNNLISGYTHQGVSIMRWSPGDPVPQRNLIEGNAIGLALNGGGYIPNGNGININSSTDNILFGNEVAGNTGVGIFILDDLGEIPVDNKISQNLIHSNGQMGIDLNSDGVTTNDLLDHDPDEGPNHLQNYPELDSISFAAGNVTVGGHLRSKGESPYIVEFYASSIADLTTYGEGEYYLGCDTVMTNDAGYVYFVTNLPTQGYGAQVISATATDLDGNTSEFSQVIGGVMDQVLADINMPFRYTLNDEALPTIPFSEIENAVSSAFQTWDDVPGADIEMVHAGNTSARYASASDGVNLVSFQDDRFPFSKGVLAVTTKTLKMTAGGTVAEILDADIIFNPEYVNDENNPFAILTEDDLTTQAFDIQSVATHEIGHVLGMIHTGVYYSTMFFMLDYGTYERTLEPDDMAWAGFRYPTEEFFDTHGFISGTVTYGDIGDIAMPWTHPPLAGALVLAINTETQELFHAYTDANGEYTVPISMEGAPSDEYWIRIQPLDGNVFGTNLKPGNISPYIYSHTIFTDFPQEFFNINDSSTDEPGDFDEVVVNAGATTDQINLITNKDQTAPTVVGVSPAEGDIDIAVSPTLALKFSEPVDVYSFDETTCYLESGGLTVSGEFIHLGYDSTHIVIMRPNESLLYSTSYTLHIEGITDLKDNALETAYLSSFTTTDPDLVPPSVHDVIPAHQKKEVSVTETIKVFFSEPMNKSSVESSFSLLDGNGLQVPGDTNWDRENKIFAYLPDYSLEEEMDYTINLTTQATDLPGNAMVNEAIYTFSTIDVASPGIIYLGPGDEDVGITVETPVVVKVTEPLNVTTITASSFRLNGTAGQVSGHYEYLDSDRTIVFRPANSLNFEEVYTVTLTSDISDLSNPRQFLDFTEISFTTAAAVLNPHIEYIVPPFGPVGAQVTIAGSGFDPVPGNNNVTFSGLTAQVTKATLESLTLDVPSGAVDGPVTVSVLTGPASNSFLFDVVPPNTDPSYNAIASSTAGSKTRSIVLNPDAGYAYVTNWGDNTVTPIDISGEIPKAGTDINVGVEPTDIDINPAGTKVYVTNYLSNTVSVIGTNPVDEATFHLVTDIIPVGYHPYGVAVSSDKLVYVANNESEYVSVIDVDPTSGGFDHVIANVTTGTKNRSIVVTPDAALILITGDNGVTIIDRDPLSPTFDQVIASAQSGSKTRGISITPDAALALAITEDGNILVIDIFQPRGTEFGNVIASVTTGSKARNITISPDAMYVYITNPDDNTISIFQLDYSIIPGYGASFNQATGLILLETIQVDEAPYAIIGHPSNEYLLVTHDSEAGGVSKIGIEEESIDPIYTLAELITSVRDAVQEGLIPRNYGDKLLPDLDKTLSRINSDQLESAIDHLDNFIVRVTRWTRSGAIPDDLGNAWLEAAHRIREQLVKDLLAQEDLLKGTGTNGSDTRTSADGLMNSNQDLPGEQTLKLQNQPNPFNYQTRINFEIPEIGRADIPVIMRVFNTNGQVVRTLVHMDMEPGRYSVDWSGSLDDVGLVPDGIYLLELSIPGQRETLTISLIR